MNYRYIGFLFLALLLATASLAGTIQAETSPVKSGEIKAGDVSENLGIQNQQGPTINVTKVYALAREPGSIVVKVGYEIPESFSSTDDLEARYPCSAKAVSMTGFEKKEVEGTDGNCHKLVWKGNIREPSFVIKVEVDEKTSDGYVFRAEGSWALFPKPFIPTVTQANLDKLEATKIQGHISNSMVFLGDSTTYRTSGLNQNFTLVVPGKVNLVPPRKSLFNALEMSSNMLYMNGKSDEVGVFVAYESFRDGGKTVSNDFWVKESTQLDKAGSPWFEEYYNTRESYTLSSNMEWFDNAAPEYYSALLPTLQERTSVPSFKSFISKGQEHDSVVLSDNSTWGTPQNVREKGALVLSELDLRIRKATGNSRTLQDVVAKMDGKNLNLKEFENLVSDVAGKDMSNFISKYISSPNNPSTITQNEYRRNFEVPHTYIVDMEDKKEVRKGSTTKVNVTLSNAGFGTDSQTVSLKFGGEKVDTKKVNIPSGKSKEITFTLDTQPVDPGNRTYSVVTDNYTEKRKIDVLSPVLPDFSYSPRIPGIGEEIQFTDQSRSIGAEIKSWTWKFGDGETSNLQNPTHSYSQKGTYEVTLKVTDSRGYTNKYTEKVVVPQKEWQRTYTDTEGGIVDIAQSGDRYILSGFFDGSDIIGADSNGNKQWTRKYFDQLGAGVYEFAKKDDGALIVGKKMDNGYLLRLDSNWYKESEKGFFDVNQIRRIKPTLDGNFFLIGESNTRPWVAKINSTGGVKWEKKFGENTDINDIIQIGGGEYMIVGDKPVNGAVKERIMRVNEQGRVIWSETYLDGQLRSIVKAGSGTYLAGGSSGVLKIDARGDKIFRELESKNVNKIKKIGYVGYVIIGGASNKETEGTDGWISMMEGNGEVRWSETQGDDGYDAFMTVTRTKNSFIAAGENSGSPFVAKINSRVRNYPPKANFSYTPKNPDTGNNIQFKEMAKDIDGTIKSWKWEFGDGETSTEKNPTHNYDAPGSYEVTLTVTDKVGGTDTVKKTIDVKKEGEDKSIPEVISNTKTKDDKINFAELQVAIQYWVNEETVPGTEQKLDFTTLQKIIQYWIQGKKF